MAEIDGKKLISLLVKGKVREKGAKGTTFIPSVDDSGNLSWENDDGLENPKTVNIKGPHRSQF